MDEVCVNTKIDFINYDQIVKIGLYYIKHVNGTLFAVENLIKKGADINAVCYDDETLPLAGYPFTRDTPLSIVNNHDTKKYQRKENKKIKEYLEGLKV